jgi:hypothetical protein
MEAEKLGLDEFERLSYFRADRGKGNTAPPASAATWYRFESVILANGDNVGVVTSWRMPSQTGDGPPSEAQIKAEIVFMKILDRYTLDGRHVSDQPTAANSAPRRFEEEAEAKEAKLKKRHLKDAMRRLFERKRIRVEEFKMNNRHGGRRIVRIPEEP